MKIIGRVALPPARGLGVAADIVALRYAKGGRLAIMLVEQGEPIATLSVNVPDVELEPLEFVVKGYSENQELPEAALTSGLFEQTGRTVMVGFEPCEVWRLKPGVLDSQGDATAKPTSAQTEPGAGFGLWAELDLLASLGRVVLGEGSKRETADAVERAGAYLTRAVAARRSPSMIGRRTLHFEVALANVFDTITPSVSVELDDALLAAIFEMRALCEVKALHDVSARLPVEFDALIAQELGVEPCDGALCVSAERVWLRFALGRGRFDTASLSLRDLARWLPGSLEGDALRASAPREQVH